MALTNRERLIMILAALSISILIADRYVLGPIFEKRSQVSKLKQSLQGEVAQAQATLKRRKVIKQHWVQMQRAGLSDDIGSVEGILFRHLEEASHDSALLLNSIQPERLSDEGKIGQIEFMVSGIGTMESVTRFLWNIEMAEIPLKIDSLQLSANNENAAQMSVQLKLSSIYLIEENNQKDNQS